MTAPTFDTVRDLLWAPDLADAAARVGLEIPANPVPGRIVRFATNGKASDRAGWVQVFEDGDGAVFGDWRTGASYTWQREREGPPPDPAELARIRERARKAQERVERERREQQAKAAKVAAEAWANATPAPATHPYLVAKAIQPHDVRIDADGRLLVPVRGPDGEIQSLQTIDATGSKLFLKGGRMAGGWCLIGNVQPDKPLLLAEGFATAATLHEASGLTAFCCFTAGNLEGVARYLADRYRAPLLICGDDDRETPGNPGRTKAQAAAAATGARVVFPEGNGTDFNDMAQERGLQAVRALIESLNTAPPDEAPGRIDLGDFYAHMPDHRYIFAPTRDLWPAASLDARLPWIKAGDKKIRPSQWLDQNAPIEQMLWAPGEPMVIRDRLIDSGGWLHRPGVSAFNLYRAPTLKHGDPDQAGAWVAHVRSIYEEDAEHIIQWLAHRVQRPGEKINHGVVLGGPQGIGKDTMLEPVKHAVGAWNFHEVAPGALLGRFNSFVKSVILRISEARDLGDMDRFTFYEHIKVYTAAPPDVLRCDEKNIREHSVMNVCGVIITTNHKTDGIYLPADDRRHFVAWSDVTRDQFDDEYWRNLWDWYEQGGIAHVAAYLATLDLAGFNPKAPPRKTPAFWHIVDAARAPEETELADLIDQLDDPDALTLSMLIQRANVKYPDFADWLSDRKNSRKVPHRLESAGYERVRNNDAKDGQWVIEGRRQAVYARRDLPVRDRIAAAERLMRGDL